MGDWVTRFWFASLITFITLEVTQFWSQNIQRPIGALRIEWEIITVSHERDISRKMPPFCVGRKTKKERVCEFSACIVVSIISFVLVQSIRGDISLLSPRLLFELIARKKKGQEDEALCPLVCQYRRGEGSVGMWIGHALISRQREINFRVQGV